MPAFLTHYACGIKGYHNLKQGELKKAISEHTNVYNVGLAGPDLFFYSIVEMVRSGMTTGRMIHKFRTGLFFRHFYDRVESLQGEDLKIGRAYLAGFIGHYCLDTNAHALIYRRCTASNEKQALGKHFRFEAAMDGMACRHILGRDINDSHQMGLIRFTGQERKVVAKVLSGAIRDTFGGEAKVPSQLRLRILFREYVLITGLLIDPTGMKEWIYQWGERKRQGFVHMSPLFINRNQYGLKEADWMQFRRRFDRGCSFLDICLNKYEDVISGKACAEELFQTIGSRSFNGMFHDVASMPLPLKELYKIDADRKKAYSDSKSMYEAAFQRTDG